MPTQNQQALLHLLQHIFSAQFSIFLPTHPYKNRSLAPITPPQFSPLYRTLSPLIAVLKALPWQMKSTFIIVLFLLVLPRNALFCEGFRVSCSLLWNYRLCQIRAEPCKLLLPVSSKMERVTTKDFIRHPYSTSVYTNNSIFDVYHIVFQLLPYYVILALLTDDTQICALIPLSHIPYLSP